VGLNICRLRLCISTSEIKSLRRERSKEKTPDTATSPLSGSFHPTQQQLSRLSTNSGVVYSSMPHDGLVRFRTRQHYSITPSSTNLYTPFCSESSTNLRPPSSLSMVPNRPFCVQPPEHVDSPAPVQRLCIQRGPLPLWSLRAPSFPDADASYGIESSAPQEVRRVHRDSEVYEGQYWRENGVP